MVDNLDFKEVYNKWYFFVLLVILFVFLLMYIICGWFIFWL